MLDVTAIARDPHWFAHRYDETRDEVHFLPLTRDEHRAATFITKDYLPADRAPAVIDRRTALAAAADCTAPIHFIFHSAFCCSTLVARAFDREGIAMGLKEPTILNDIVGWRRRGGAARDVAERLDGILSLLSRPFSAGEAVIIKPSNVLNGLARLILAMRPGANALLLHAPLETFLTSVAKKDIDGRLWVRELFIGLRKDGLVQNLGFNDEQFFGQTDLQIAAAGWLAQQALFASLVEELGPTRVRTLDSETLLARPDDTIVELARHCGLRLSPADIEEIGRGPAFTRHAKTNQDFTAQDRAEEYRDATAAHGDEIAKVGQWAQAVADFAGIPMKLGAPLLS